MTTTLVIRKKLDVEGKYLTKNIEENILLIARETLVNECDKENGYILSVDKVENIIDFVISNATNRNILTADLIVKAIKPESGKELTGKVCMVFSGGLFIKVENRIQILIPGDSLNENYKLNTEGNAFIKQSYEPTKTPVSTSTTTSKGLDDDSKKCKKKKEDIKNGFNSIFEYSSNTSTTTANEEDIIKENDIVRIRITSSTYTHQKKFSSYGEFLSKIKM